MELACCLIASVLIVVGGIVAIIKMSEASHAEDQARIHNLLGVFARFNSEIDISLPETAEDFRGEVLGTSEVGICFDWQKRVACIFIYPNCKMVGLSYFRGWQLRWTDVSDGYSNHVSQVRVHIQFSVNNIEHPLFVVACKNMEEGEHWNAKLNMMMGGE